MSTNGELERFATDAWARICSYDRIGERHRPRSRSQSLSGTYRPDADQYGNGNDRTNQRPSPNRPSKHEGAKHRTKEQSDRNTPVPRPQTPSDNSSKHTYENRIGERRRLVLYVQILTLLFRRANLASPMPVTSSS